MNTIVRPDVLHQFRLRLPNAAGASLSDDDLHGIRDAAIDQCRILHDGRYKDWITDPSIQDSLLLSTYIYGQETRKFGGNYRSVHLVGVGHRSANRPDKPYLSFDSIKASAKAFVGVNHDNPEDATDDPDERLVVVDLALLCWHGHPNFVPAFRRDIIELSDSPNLDPFARKNEQIIRAWSATGRAVITRLHDKEDNTEGDDHLVKTGVISDPAEIIARARLARDKTEIVKKLPPPVTDADKASYMKSVESLESQARAVQKSLPLRAIIEITRQANSIYERLSRFVGPSHIKAASP